MPCRMRALLRVGRPGSRRNREERADYPDRWTSSGDARAVWGTYMITSVDKATVRESVRHGRFVDVQKQVDGK